MGKHRLFCTKQPYLTYFSGPGGETSCYQDDGALLLPQPPLYCHGTAEHQSIRTH